MNEIISNSWRLNNELAEFLDGKSVAILGRGPVLNRLSADLIESYDVIVRMHRPIPGGKRDYHWGVSPFVPEEWQCKIGKRTDVFFHDWNGVDRDVVRAHVESFKSDGGRFLCVDVQNYNPNNFEYHSWIDKELMLVRKPNYVVWHYLSSLIKDRVHAGTEIVYDILSFNVKSVFLGGLTTRFAAGGGKGDKSTEAVLANARAFYLLRQSHGNKIAVDAEMEASFSEQQEINAKTKAASRWF